MKRKLHFSGINTNPIDYQCCFALQEAFGIGRKDAVLHNIKFNWSVYIYCNYLIPYGICQFSQSDLKLFRLLTPPYNKLTFSTPLRKVVSKQIWKHIRNDTLFQLHSVLSYIVFFPEWSALSSFPSFLLRNW